MGPSSVSSGIGSLCNPCLSDECESRTLTQTASMFEREQKESKELKEALNERTKVLKVYQAKVRHLFTRILNLNGVMPLLTMSPGGESERSDERAEGARVQVFQIDG